MGLAITIFIITTIYVGYHPSQELPKEIVKTHGEIIELFSLNN